MTDERKALLALAATVGLVVDVDFNKTIKSEKLQEMIDKKQVELENQLKGSTDENNTNDEQENKTPIVDGVKENESNTEDQSPKIDIPTEEDNQENTEEAYELNEMPILRTSQCENYKATIIGIKECARRSGLTVEEVTICLESGESAPNGWKSEEK